MQRCALFLILLCVGLAACTDGREPATPTLSPTPENATADTSAASAWHMDGTVHFNRSGVEVELPRPAGWDSFSTEYGVVIAEKFGSIANRGELHGLMVYVFVTPLAEFPFTSAAHPIDNRAAAVFAGITGNSLIHGEANASGVTGFRWQGRDAAYYVFTDRHTGLRTLIIGVVLDESDVLLTSSISAPPRHESKILAVMPHLMAGMRINNRPMEPAVLDILPAKLEFPE